MFSIGRTYQLNRHVRFEEARASDDQNEPHEEQGSDHHQKVSSRHQHQPDDHTGSLWSRTCRANGVVTVHRQTRDRTESIRQMLQSASSRHVEATGRAFPSTLSASAPPTSVVRYTKPIYHINISLYHVSCQYIIYHINISYLCTDRRLCWPPAAPRLGWS
eukprot:SAG31_NODE_12412_length_944_cov_0.792899_1_plen_160_part_10